ncbi:hypothetical protein L7F22_039501 [Adiantum nelumboides]|nr:hypothetical protein [Adiantum nelumboides]
MRWIVELQLFYYELKSRPLALQKLIDCLVDVFPCVDEPENVTHDLFCIELSREWYDQIASYLSTLEFPPEMSKTKKKRLVTHAQRFYIIEGELYQKGFVGLYRRCVCKEEIPHILKECHDSACGGHFAGRLTALKILRPGYWWPSVFMDSFEWCKRCDLCQRATRLENHLRPNNPIMIALPFEKRGIDYVGPITLTSRHGTAYIIVAIDYLTKWSKARAMRSDDARTTANFLIDHVICHFGAPAELVYDRGTHFLNDVLEDLTSYFNIRHDKTTPYKPSTNGQVESTNKTLVTILRKTVDVNKRDWDEKLSAAIWAYNTTFKEAMGFTPFSLVYGQECVLPIEHELSTSKFLHEHSLPLEKSLKERLGTLEHIDEWRLRAYLHQEVAKKRQTKQRAKKAKIYDFEDGQLVLLYDARHELFPGKLSHVWSGPYRIVKVFYRNKV